MEDCDRMISKIFSGEKVEHDILIEPQIERAAIRYAQ